MRDISKPQANLDILLEDTVASYYWIGFLMADGYINHNVKRLKLTLAQKDADHVAKFAAFIQCPNCRADKNNKSYTVSVQDKDAIGKIIAKYDFRPRKSYNPPDISNIDGDLFLAFVIGFIDGDGRITKQYRRDDALISIKNHRSWLEILSYIVQKLYTMCSFDCFPIARINKSGYAIVNITNSVVLRFLKLRSTSLGLPVLARKWDLINEHFCGKVELARERCPKIIAMHNAGFRGKDIAASLGVSKSCVSRILSNFRREGGV